MYGVKAENTYKKEYIKVIRDLIKLVGLGRSRFWVNNVLLVLYYIKVWKIKRV